MPDDTKGERIRQLEQEVFSLSQQLRNAVNSLDLAAGIGTFDTRLNTKDDPQAIFLEAEAKLSQILRFRALSFYLVAEADNSFYQAFCRPEDMAGLLQREFNLLVEDRTFSWALSRSRPVFVRASQDKGHLLLHTLATHQRTRGMLIGLLGQEKGSIPESALSLLTLVCLSCANFLESFELYKHFHRMNADMQEALEEMQRANQELIRKNEQLEQAVISRQRAEMAKDRNEEQTWDLLESLDDGYYQVDLSGNLLACNEALASLVGYERRELLGQNYRLIADASTSGQIFRSFNDVYKSGRSGKFLGWEFICRDGSKRSVQASASLLKDEAGVSIGFQGIVQDITEQRRIEEQLRQAQKMEAIGTLTGGISHEFNNLLQGFAGNIQLLEEHLPEKARERRFVDELRRFNERASRIVNRLLTFSRKSEFSFQAVDLNEVISGVISLLRKTISRGISLETDLATGLPAIYADETQLEQILMNLVINSADALEHRDDGRVVIGTSLGDKGTDQTHGQPETGSFQPPRFVQLSVSDNGHGMDKATVAQIFDPFFTTKEPGQGTGIGLSTVYGIVKGHSASIECRSEPGRGTVFEIVFPAIGSSRPLSSREEEAGSELQVGAASDLEGLGVLLVEDEEVILEATAEMLQHRGMTVHSASSGEEAVAVYQEQARAIDLVFLDLGMPGMGGERTLRAMLEQDPEVRVVVTSGSTNHPLARQPEAYGAAGFLGKPYRLDDLLEMVRLAGPSS